jgi:hypothetical protein
MTRSETGNGEAMRLPIATSAIEFTSIPGVFNPHGRVPNYFAIVLLALQSFVWLIRLK